MKISVCVRKRPIFHRIQHQQAFPMLHLSFTSAFSFLSVLPFLTFALLFVITFFQYSQQLKISFNQLVVVTVEVLIVVVVNILVVDYSHYWYFNCSVAIIGVVIVTEVVWYLGYSGHYHSQNQSIHSLLLQLDKFHEISWVYLSFLNEYRT